MKIPLTTMENVTLEKVKFIEDQASKCLGFFFESNEVLTKEAHTSLNWLFAIITTTSAYTIDHFDSHKLWLFIPLICAIGVATIEGIELFRNALRTEDLLPIGNEPKNLISDTQMLRDEASMRLAEVASLQERIECAGEHNSKVGNAINRARLSVALIPIGTLIGIALGYLIFKGFFC